MDTAWLLVTTAEVELLLASEASVLTDSGCRDEGFKVTDNDGDNDDD